MKKSATRSLSILLLFTLVLYSAKVTFALTEIAYDDGSPETTSSLDIGLYLAVKFSLPPGVSEAMLTAARLYKAGRSGIEVRIHVLGSDGIKELTAPVSFRLATESAWNDLDLLTRNLVISNDFYIAVEYLAFYDPLLGRDSSSPKNRSYYGRPGSWSLVVGGENVMIRAVVDSSKPLLTASIVRSGLFLAGVGVVSTTCAILLRKWGIKLGEDQTDQASSSRQYARFVKHDPSQPAHHNRLPYARDSAGANATRVTYSRLLMRASMQL